MGWMAAAEHPPLLAKILFFLQGAPFVAHS
jgi:hypothetical protein